MRRPSTILRTRRGTGSTARGSRPSGGSSGSPPERVIERYRGPRGETLAVDTVYYTHRGPMRRTRDGWLSMRWTVLENGTELAAFTDAAHARSAADFQARMSASIIAPAQNMLAADR